MLSILARSIDLAQTVLENQRKILNEVFHLHFASRRKKWKRRNHCEIESSMRLLQSDMKTHSITLGLLKRDASEAIQMVSSSHWFLLVAQPE